MMLLLLLLLLLVLMRMMLMSRRRRHARIRPAAYSRSIPIIHRPVILVAKTIFSAGASVKAAPPAAVAAKITAVVRLLRGKLVPLQGLQGGILRQESCGKREGWLLAIHTTDRQRLRNWTQMARNLLLLGAVLAFALDGFFV
jgi:hypothetical protein